jgi:release factor glutamine methyltransferase
MTSIGTCLAQGSARLAAAGIGGARKEARLLLSHATGFALEMLIGYPERPVDNRREYERLLARRAAREPLSHLLGRREFWSLDFTVTGDTLDPRADSETVIEAALERIFDRSAALRIADLGTGTGCLLAALLSKLPHASGLALDRDPAAAVIAAHNFAALGFGGRAQVMVGDWGDALSGKFDLVVANPPYIPSDEIGGLQPEVAVYEPRRALDGGRDGLSALRRVIAGLPAMLAAGGTAVVEFGDGQGVAVTGLTVDAGLSVVALQRDLGGRDRCIVCQAP